MTGSAPPTARLGLSPASRFPGLPGPPVAAAGGVLWRPAQGSGHPLEVAVVHRVRQDDWSLPKGKLEPDEHWLEAAVREVAEETGWRGRVGRPLGHDDYQVLLRDGRRATKTVRWWAMQATGPVGPGPVPGEVDEVRWLHPTEAAPLLTRDLDRRRLALLVAAGAATTTVVLVRHASAGSRQHWGGDDADRPLDATGTAQVARLDAVVAAWSPERVLSAHPRRCVDTVRASARRLGVALEVDDLLAAGRAPGPAAAALRTLAAAGRPALVCGQGEVLPPVVAALAAEDGVVLEAGPTAAKGSAWVLSFAGARLVAAEHHPDLEPPRLAAH